MMYERPFGGRRLGLAMRQYDRQSGIWANRGNSLFSPSAFQNRENNTDGKSPTIEATGI